MTPKQTKGPELLIRALRPLRTPPTTVSMRRAAVSRLSARTINASLVSHCWTGA